MKAGIDAHLIKEELSEWNEYGKQIMYRINIIPAGGHRGESKEIYSILLYSSLLELNLCYTEFKYPRDAYTCTIFSI